MSLPRFPIHGWAMTNPKPPDKPLCTIISLGIQKHAEFNICRLGLTKYFSFPTNFDSLGKAACKKIFSDTIPELPGQSTLVQNYLHLLKAFDNV